MRRPSPPTPSTHPPEQIERVEWVISANAGHKHEALHASALGSSNQVQGALVLQQGNTSHVAAAQHE